MHIQHTHYESSYIFISDLDGWIPHCNLSVNRASQWSARPNSSVLICPLQLYNKITIEKGIYQIYFITIRQEDTKLVGILYNHSIC